MIATSYCLLGSSSVSCSLSLAASSFVSSFVSLVLSVLLDSDSFPLVLLFSMLSELLFSVLFSLFSKGTTCSFSSYKNNVYHISVQMLFISQRLLDCSNGKYPITRYYIFVKITYQHKKL